MSKPKSPERLQKFVSSRFETFGKNLFKKQTTGESLHVPEVPAEAQPTLYLHVPFCHAPLCEMCPFFRKEMSQPLAQQYLADLRQELSMYANHSFKSVYIGGGTPATVLPELMSIVSDHGIGKDELSVEAHPSDLTEQNIAIMKEAGVTRLSVGVQSFQEELLAQMGRNNGRSPIENLQRAQEAFAVNADLIYNFAGQTVEQFLQDLDTLISLEVSQITCYPLMATPGSFQEVDDSNEAKFYSAMLTRFKEAKYTALTPWCFTRNVTDAQGEYISNKSGEQYIGVGASSISKRENLFTINTFNLQDYHQSVSQQESAVVGYRKLSVVEDAQYFLLTGLFGMRMNLNHLTGNPLKDQLIRAEVQALRVMKLVTVQDGVAELTEDGMLFFSKIMKDFYTGLNFFRQDLKQDGQEKTSVMTR